jgi:serine/threonine protein kinase
VVLRDLKPENFIFARPGDDAVLKLGDFGLAQIIPTPDAVLTKVCCCLPSTGRRCVLKRHFDTTCCFTCVPVCGGSRAAPRTTSPQRCCSGSTRKRVTCGVVELSCISCCLARCRSALRCVPRAVADFRCLCGARVSRGPTQAKNTFRLFSEIKSAPLRFFAKVCSSCAAVMADSPTDG